MDESGTHKWCQTETGKQFSPVSIGRFRREPLLSVLFMINLRNRIRVLHREQGLGYFSTSKQVRLLILIFARLFPRASFEKRRTNKALLIGFKPFSNIQLEFWGKGLELRKNPTLGQFYKLSEDQN